MQVYNLFSFFSFCSKRSWHVYDEFNSKKYRIPVDVWVIEIFPDKSNFFILDYYLLMHDSVKTAKQIFFYVTVSFLCVCHFCYC